MAIVTRLRWVLLFALGLAALVNLGLALALVPRSDEIRYGEAIIYAQANRLLHGQALYQSPDSAPYTVTAYTPVYYWVVAGLRAIFGPGFIPGRLVSLAAALVASGLVAQLTWRRTRAVWPALGASLLFLGLGVPIPWLAAYKEDLLGVACALGSIAVLDGGATRARAIASAVLAALAILTKQTLFGPALIGMLWLAMSDRKLAGLYAGALLGLVLGVVVALEVTTHAFLASAITANLNQFSGEILKYNLIVLALFQTGPLLIGLAYLLPRLGPKTVSGNLLVGAWVISLIPVLGVAKEGADYNYWQLCAAMTAVVSMTAVWQQRGRHWRIASGLVLGLNLAVAIAVMGTGAINQTRPDPAAERAFERLVASARVAPGAVLADPLDVPVLADRSIVLEPFTYRMFSRLGRWDETPVVRSVCSGDVSLLVLAYPLETTAGGSAAADSQWPAPVLAALREKFVLQQVVSAGRGQRFVYVPDASLPVGCVDQ